MYFLGKECTLLNILYQRRSEEISCTGKKAPIRCQKKKKRNGDWKEKSGSPLSDGKKKKGKKRPCRILRGSRWKICARKGGLNLKKSTGGGKRGTGLSSVDAG